MELEEGEMELEEGEIDPADGLPPSNAEPVLYWSTVRKTVLESAVRKLFSESSPKRQLVDASQCSDPGFAELVAARYAEVHGTAPPLSSFPSYFLRCCYVEHFFKRRIDYKAVIDSRSRDYQRKKIAAAIAGNGKITIKPPPKKKKKGGAPPIEGNVPKRPRSSSAPRSRIDLLAKLQAAKKELKAANAQRAGLEDEVVKLKRAVRPRMVLTPLEELRGGDLGPGFSGEERRKECPVCFARFSSEGWYRLGSCGHEYHLQCLMLHALCAPSCVVCQAGFPVEVYKGIGLEEHRPKTL